MRFLNHVPDQIHFQLYITSFLVYHPTISGIASPSRRRWSHSCSFWFALLYPHATILTTRRAMSRKNSVLSGRNIIPENWYCFYRFHSGPIFKSLWSRLHCVKHREKKISILPEQIPCVHRILHIVQLVIVPVGDVHIAKLIGRVCEAKRLHSVSERPVRGKRLNIWYLWFSSFFLHNGR